MQRSVVHTSSTDRCMNLEKKFIVVYAFNSFKYFFLKKFITGISFEHILFEYATKDLFSVQFYKLLPETFILLVYGKELIITLANI